MTSRGTLLRVLGVGFGLAVTIGNTVGAGILRTPGEVAAQLPHTALFLAVWVIGGIYALLGAVSLSELGAAIPRSGGYYVFAQRALGDFAGFVVGWTDWLASADRWRRRPSSSASTCAISFPPWVGATFMLP